MELKNEEQNRQIPKAGRDIKKQKRVLKSSERSDVSEGDVKEESREPLMRSLRC
jgi:hypothetical protein